MKRLGENFITDGNLVVCDISDINGGKVFKVKPGEWTVSYEKEGNDEIPEERLTKQFIKRLTVCHVDGKPYATSRHGEILIDSGLAGILDVNTFKDIPKHSAEFCEECDLLSCNLLRNPHFIPFVFLGHSDDEKTFEFLEAKSKYIENRRLSQEYIIEINPAIIRERGAVTSNSCPEGKYPVIVGVDAHKEIVKIEILFDNKNK